MKKSNILIAMVAILAAASVVKAKEMTVDFDGRGKKISTLVFTDIQVKAADHIPSRVSLPDMRRDEDFIRRLAARFVAQVNLKEIVKAHLSTRDGATEGAMLLLQSPETVVMYDEKGVYLVARDIMMGLTDRALIEKVRSSDGGDMKLSWGDIIVGVVIDCALDSDCRDDVVDYISNLEDDESDTYHNNQDGSNPNYEVYKKVK